MVNKVPPGDISANNYGRGHIWNLAIRSAMIWDYLLIKNSSKKLPTYSGYSLRQWTLSWQPCNQKWRKESDYDKNFTVRQFRWIILEFWEICNWSGSTLKEWINATKIPPHESGQSAAKDNLILLLFQFGDPFFFFFFSKLRQISSSISCMMKKKKKLIKSTGYKND